MASAEQIWSLNEGVTTFSFDSGLLDRAGVQVTYPGESSRPDSAGRTTLTLLVDASASSELALDESTVQKLPAPGIVHSGALVLVGPASRVTLSSPALVSANDGSGDLRLVADGLAGAGLRLTRVKAGVESATGAMILHGADLRLSAQVARTLGVSDLSDEVVGNVTFEGSARWAGGDLPQDGDSHEDGAGHTEDDGARAGGPDMVFCQLYGLQQFGRVGSIVGCALATTSWNIGSRDLMWFSSPDEEHPFIAMNLYRLKDDRFEQIGQSWVKHGFYALGNTQCGGTCHYESGHSQGDWLGQGCTDTYSSSLNASQSGLGPRYEINPWTGAWSYQGSCFQQGCGSNNGITRRLQVHDDDLNTALNPGATYYAEGYYVILDDVNVMNSASWKPVTVSGSPGGTWSFSMSGSGTLPTYGFAIDAWAGAQKTTLAQVVPPVEFVSPDGRCVLAAKTTDLGGGWFHYEYALLNVDMDRQVGSFSIPIGPSTQVANVDFHAVRHHNEPVNAPGGVPIDNAPWTSSVTSSEVSWSTTTNPLRWGTMYNFRFDALAPPTDVTATLGMFKTGSPTSVSGQTVGPQGGCADDPDCDDGYFCNGAETCYAGSCQPGTDPCPGQVCDEDNDVCVECLTAGDCDDGLFCNGAEQCVAYTCQPGSDPCPGQDCNEGGDVCVPTDPCSGQEVLVFKCKLRSNGNYNYIVKIKKGTAYETLTLRRDSNPATDVTVNLNNLGRGNGKWVNLPAGTHFVEIVECGVSGYMTCP